jgi:hypothetical protein
MSHASLLAGTAALLVATGAAAQSAPPSADEQIAAAVLAAPAGLRADATVWGYAPDGKFQKLREGRGELVCLGNTPGADRFHVVCYHKSLEPFMARGRSLRAQGVSGAWADSLRFAEARAGRLRLPRHAAILYALSGPPDSFDPTTGTAPAAEPSFMVYLPYATGASTGLTPTPLDRGPWIMDAGTPMAHVMFQRGM